MATLNEMFTNARSQLSEEDFQTGLSNVTQNNPKLQGLDLTKADEKQQQLIEEAILSDQALNIKKQSDSTTDEAMTSEEETAVERPVFNLGDTDTSTTEGTSFDSSLLLGGELSQPKSEEEIRQEQISRAQSIIDATEEYFASQVREISQAGQRNLARTSSAAVGAGLAGSPFQTTLEASAEQATRQELEAKQAERSGQVASLLAAAEDRATELYDREVSRFQTERSFAISEMERQQEEAKAKTEAARLAATETITSIAQSGYSLSDLTDEQYRQLLEQGGLSEFEAHAIYSQNTPEASGTFSIENGMLVNTYFDPITQKPVVRVTSLPEELTGVASADIATIKDANGNVYWYDKSNPLNEDGSLKAYSVGESAPTADDELLSVSEAEALGVPFGTTVGEAKGMGIVIGDETSTEGTLSSEDVAKTDQGKKLSGIVNLQEAIDDYKKLIEEGGLGGMSKPDQLAALNAAFAKIEFALKDAEDLGALQAPDIELIKGMIPDATLGAGEEALLAFAMGASGGLSVFEKNKISRLISSLEQTSGAYENTAQNLLEQLVSLGASPSDPYIQTLQEQLGLEVTRSGSEMLDLSTDEAIEEFLNNIDGGSSPFSSDLSTSVKGSGASSILGLGVITSNESGSPYWSHGLDIDLKKGDPVANVGSGKVIFADWNPNGFGYQVKVLTSSGNEVWYSHLDGINVSVGDSVKDGQILGLGGNTGKVIAGPGGDGSHLDLTVRKSDGTYYTPTEIERLLRQYA